MQEKLITMRNKITQEVVRVNVSSFLHYMNLGFNYTTKSVFKKFRKNKSQN
jgi:hypothetical protein